MAYKNTNMLQFFFVYFKYLKEISMIWWALAIAAFVLEIFSGTFYLLVLSIAFLLTGILNATIQPALAVNITVCAVLAIIGIFIVASLQRRKKLIPESQNTQYDDLDIGQSVTIAQNNGGGLYQVHYRGTIWQAHAQKQDLSQNTQAKIVNRNGNILEIQPTGDSSC